MVAITEFSLSTVVTPPSAQMNCGAAIEAFLTQDKNERAELAACYGHLAEILGLTGPTDEAPPAEAPA